jgi:hypothetical protein
MDQLMINIQLRELTLGLGVDVGGTLITVSFRSHTHLHIRLWITVGGNMITVYIRTDSDSDSVQLERPVGRPASETGITVPPTENESHSTNNRYSLVIQ